MLWRGKNTLIIEALMIWYSHIGQFTLRDVSTQDIQRIISQACTITISQGKWISIHNSIYPYSMPARMWIIGCNLDVRCCLIQTFFFLLASPPNSYEILPQELPWRVCYVLRDELTCSDPAQEDCCFGRISKLGNYFGHSECWSVLDIWFISLLNSWT